MSETFVEESAVTEAALPDSHPGVEDGTVDAAGEKIVHELDELGAVIGWHKEPAA